MRNEDAGNEPLVFRLRGVVARSLDHTTRM